MIENGQKIFDYLPMEYKTPIESNYIVFLWDSFTVNYEKEKYQFAYIAYHMLFMCFVYFQLAKIYLNKPDDIKKIMVFTGKAQSAIDNYEQKLKEAIKRRLPTPHFDPFSLAGEYERSILGLFISIGCDRETIKRMKNIVDGRNDIAHSNGIINFSNHYNLDDKVEEILVCIDCIQENSRSIITSSFEKFLLESANPDEREFPDEENQVREIFVRGNYLSLEDLRCACQHDISNYSAVPHFSAIEKLHQKLLDMYQSE